jgi:carbon-monoxide dehydrogenase small subunit
LLGAKGACEQGECGSCSVLVDDVLVCSCLVMAASVVDQPIVTIEGIAPVDAPSDVQQAFVEAGAVQCGFCTPGMVLSAKALLDRCPEPSEEDVRRAISGNLCRCTGYQKIVEGILRASRLLREAAARGSSSLQEGRP